MATTVKELHLTCLDQTVLRMYIRHLLVFPFPDPSYAEAAVNALRVGFTAVLADFPFLAGTILPSDSESRRITLKYPENVTSDLVSQILSISFDQAKNPNLDYESLGREGMPPLKLPGDLFCPELVRDHPGLDDRFAEGITRFKKGLSIPVFAAQANFIPGGLIVSVYAHHSAMDGNGLGQVYQIWSDHVRSHIRREQTPNLVAPSAQSISTAQDNATDPSYSRRTLDALAKCFPSTTNLREVRTPGTTPTVLRNARYNLKAKIFVFKASKITSLSAQLSSKTNTHISIFTTLSALLWTHITRARSAVLAGKGIQKTELGIAFDHRKNLGSPFTRTFFGNCATGVTVPLPVSNLIPSGPLRAEDLASIAVDIAQSLSAVNLKWLQARLSYFSQTPNPSALSLNLDLVNGPDLFITSWLHMGADCDWGIPGTGNDGYPIAIRKPMCANEGSIVLLPRQKDGGQGFEALVCLEQGEMEAAGRSLGEGMWLERIIDA